MFENSKRSIVLSSSAALFIGALGAHSFGASTENACRDVQADIRTIKLAVGALNEKADRSIAAIGVLDSKADQSRVDLGALSLAMGVLDGKADQSRADLEIVHQQLRQIREAIQVQNTHDLQLEVMVDESACASVNFQCASPTLPSSTNQIPIAVNLLVLDGQDVVTNLGVADIDMITAFMPSGGPILTACEAGAKDCGSSHFFLNKGDGSYQMWVHPTTPWVRGTYVLRLRVTDIAGRTATKLARVTIDTGPPAAPHLQDGGAGQTLKENREHVEATQ